MKVAIIKYNAGNTQSVKYALERLGVAVNISDDIELLKKADKIIFPGVGHAKPAMEYLKNARLDKFIQNTKQDFLGICLGMQLLCKHSEEGDTECLGIFDTKVQKFPETSSTEKIPHMGWNKLKNLEGQLTQKFPEENYVYFVHSFYVPLNQYTTAQAWHIQDFSAMMQKDNFYATQFHPEKSAEIGSQILESFLDLA